MLENNITIDDIQTRKYHIENYENLKKLNNVQTYISDQQKRKINYIFNFYKKERSLPSYPSSKWDVCPCQECRQKRSHLGNNFNEDRTRTITTNPNPNPNLIYPINVYLIKIRYEIKRNEIKRQLLKECKCACCSEAW